MATPVHSQSTALAFQESTKQLEVIARRVAWWKTPAEALVNTNDFRFFADYSGWSSSFPQWKSMAMR
jgi:hypothetical protein